MTCYFCGQPLPEHDGHCPRIETAEWQRGRDHGLAGLPAQEHTEVYRLGWHQGNRQWRSATAAN